MTDTSSDTPVLVAMDAAPASYVMNLGAASVLGDGVEQVRGVLAAVAPIVGTARIVSATGNIVEARDIALEVAELDHEEEQGED